MPPRSSPRPSQPPRRQPNFTGTTILSVILFAAFLSVIVFPLSAFVGGRQVKTSEFYALLAAGKLKAVEFVGKDRLTGTADPDSELATELKLANGHFAAHLGETADGHAGIKAELQKQKVPFDSRDDHAAWLGPAVAYLLLTGLALFAFYAIVLSPRIRDPMGPAGIGNYIRSPAKRYDKPKVKPVTFADVADMDSAKRELEEVVEFLKTPDKFQKLGAQVPRGVLLVGPPGTGKTLLARAVAGEATVPFFSMNGSEFIQMFVGVGASRVRDLFKTAKESAPCLVFIDEIDAVGRMRGAGVGGGSDEREQTLNQILSEMDGFAPNETVIVVAATNRPDVLDSALLRPGRFDRHVTVDRPNWRGRLQILQLHTKNKPLAADVDLEQIARTVTGMTGADLRMLANEAALLASRGGKEALDRSDFGNAIDRVLIGPKREEVLSVEAKRRIAVHEAGHALVAWLEPQAERPIKVSIVPRGRTGGVNLTVPDEDRFHHGRDYFEARLTMLMGGRAADRLVFSQPDAGAVMDIRDATKLARTMVANWGMSERVGPMAFRVGEEHVFLGKELQEQRDFSEGMALAIDEEVQALLRAADERALGLLRDRRLVLDLLVDELLKHEELDRAAIDALLAPHGITPPPPRDEGGRVEVAAPG